MHGRSANGQRGPKTTHAKACACRTSPNGSPPRAGQRSVANRRGAIVRGVGGGVTNSMTTKTLWSLNFQEIGGRIPMDAQGKRARRRRRSRTGWGFTIFSAMSGNGPPTSTVRNGNAISSARPIPRLAIRAAVRETVRQSTFSGRCAAGFGPVWYPDHLCQSVSLCMQRSRLQDRFPRGARAKIAPVTARAEQLTPLLAYELSERRKWRIGQAHRSRNRGPAPSFVRTRCRQCTPAALAAAGT